MMMSWRADAEDAPWTVPGGYSPLDIVVRGGCGAAFAGDSIDMLGFPTTDCPTGRMWTGTGPETVTRAGWRRCRRSPHPTRCWRPARKSNNEWHLG